MLGRQWETRLRIWKEHLETCYLRKAFSVETEYCTTFRQIGLENARQARYQRCEVGTRWGEKWEYGWFRTRITVPESLAGKRLCLFLGTAPELLVYKNGEEAGSIDKKHSLILLTAKAAARECFEIYAEGYAGHGIRREDAGPFAVDEITIPEVTEKQVRVEPSYVVVWDEALFQVFMDYLCLYDLFGKLPETSLRRMKIIEGLKAFTFCADFELPEQQLRESILKAGELLKPLLACKNGSTAPEFTIFGQSHIDLAWLWHEEETKRKAARTYANQLALMEEYPEFRFLLCAPTVLEYNRTYHPKLYKRILKARAEGRMIPEGAMWIECDTNIPSGESLIRQFVKGKQWYQQEMGVNSVLAWMPDTFGFSGALPQIMKKCGVKYFATQKLLRADPETEPFPYNIFWWEGIDGSRVLSHIYKKNNSQLTPAHLIERWEVDRNQQENIDSMLFPFGFGDGGGGCTRVMLEQARRCRDLEGAPRCTMESPVAFFDRICGEAVENTYCGELYLAWHRGTLTAQAETKRGIRRAEEMLHNLEFLTAVLMLQGYGKGQLKKAVVKEAKCRQKTLWEALLFCQFHDIAPGTSIERVHQEAVLKLQQILTEGKQLAEQLLQGIFPAGTGLKLISAGEAARMEQPLCVWNTTSFEKQYRGHAIVPYGWKLLSERKQTGTVKGCFCGSYYEIQNEFYTAQVDLTGRIFSCRDTAGREYVDTFWNEFLMFKDVNVDYDAWELGAMYQQLPVELSDAGTVTAAYEQDFFVITVTRMLNHSELEQRIVFKPDCARIDFETRIHWNERHKLLKVGFSTAIYSKEAVEEIQFGYVKRPTHRSRQWDRDRYEVSNQRYTAITDQSHTVAVLNDGKYGVNVVDNSIRLSLLRAPLVPDMRADKGEHTFTYSVYLCPRGFVQSETVKEAYDLNYQPLLLSGNFRPDGVEKSFFHSTAENVVIETVKPADAVENAIVLRLYEAKGMSCAAELCLPEGVKSAAEVNLLEQEPKPCLMQDRMLRLSFTPFEIKTVMITLEEEGI